MKEVLRPYTPEEAELFIIFDYAAEMVDTIRRDQDFLDRGGKIVFFKPEIDRSFVVDKKTAVMIVNVVERMFSQLIEIGLKEEAEGILQSRRNEGV